MCACADRTVPYLQVNILILRELSIKSARQVKLLYRTENV
jgi:hypothetical protein